MSVFTNAASAASDEASAYVAAVLELVGNREPLAILASLSASLDELLADLSDEQLRRQEAPGKWSIVMVVQHLADSELMWAYRLRAVITEESPRLAGYDQDVWAERLGYHQARLEDGRSQLAVLRAANLRLLRSLTPEQWRRAAMHAERGAETIEHMTRLYAGHDLVHLRQIARLRDRLDR